MYISKASLKNIRGFGPKGLIADFAKSARHRDGCLAGWSVIAGPNGSGKSSLLQAIAASLLGPTGSAWLLRPDDREDWIHRTSFDAMPGDQGSTCAWVQRVSEDDGASPADDTDKPIPLRVEWSRHIGGRTFPPKGNHNFVSTQFWDASAYGVKPDGWIFTAYGPRRSAQRSSNDAASLLKAPPRMASVTTLFRDDVALDEGHRWLLRLVLGEDRRSEHEKILVKGVLRFLGDGLLDSSSSSTFQVKEDGLWISIDGAPHQPVRMLGDGYRILVGLVLDILYQIERFKPGRLGKEIQGWPKDPSESVDIKMSGVVIIDEPENHLHPAVQQRLGFWLKAHFPRMQFIVATHSALVCQAADKGGLFRLWGPERFESLDEETWETVTNGTINDAVTTALFGFSNSYAPEGLKIRQKLIELDAAIQGGDLSQETLQRRAELMAMLPNPVDHEVAAALRLAASRS